MLASSSKHILLIFATFSAIFSTTHASPLALSTVPSVDTFHVSSRHYVRSQALMPVPRDHVVIEAPSAYRCFPNERTSMLTPTFYAKEIADYAPYRQLENDYFTLNKYADTAAKIKAITNPADKGKLTWDFGGEGYITFCAKKGDVDLAPLLVEFNRANNFLERTCGSRVAGAVGMRFKDKDGKLLPGVEVVYGRETLVKGKPSLIKCEDYVE